jgi:LysM repeat protein
MTVDKIWHPSIVVLKMPFVNSRECAMISRRAKQMKEWKRLIYYLLINILVSACTTVAVLYLWDRTHPPALVNLQPQAINVSGSSEGAPAATVPVTSTLGAQTEPITVTVAGAPTQDPYANAIAYEVKSNDTMGEIANKFDVDLKDLLKYNALSDANALSVGQVIYIPVTPQAPPTETPAPEQTPTVQGTGSPAAPAQPAKVIISSVIGPGDLSSERVFLTRSGDGPLSLAGWRLEDEDGNQFVFPSLELVKDGATVSVFSNRGRFILGIIQPGVEVRGDGHFEGRQGESPSNL